MFKYFENNASSGKNVEWKKFQSVKAETQLSYLYFICFSLLIISFQEEAPQFILFFLFLPRNKNLILVKNKKKYTFPFDKKKIDLQIIL